MALAALAVVALLSFALPGGAGAQGASPGNSGNAPGTDVAATQQAARATGTPPGLVVAATAQAGGGGVSAGAGQGNQGNQGNTGGTGGTGGAGGTGGSGTQPGQDRSITKSVVGSTNDGRGVNAAPVPQLGNAVFQIEVKGPPPGNSGQRGEVVDNIPPHFEYISSEGAPVKERDSNKVTFEVDWSQRTSVSIRVTLKDVSSPCNHVATNVAHVNGIGSAQAQVRVTCPTPTNTPVVAAGALAASPTPTATSTRTTGPDRLEVKKTLEDEDDKNVGRIDSSHLGKLLKYNILIRRNGGLPGRTQMAFTDVMQPCGADSVQEFFPEVVRAEIQGGDSSDEFSYTINGCTVEGRISGDNKANFDASGPGNQFHVHIWVRLPQPGTRAAQNPPAAITNNVTASV